MLRFLAAASLAAASISLADDSESTGGFSDDVIRLADDSVAAK